MTLRAIVAALGGDLYAGGCRANVPAPGHSRADRSVSLLLSEGRVIAHGFGGADWRDVRDHLRARGLIDAEGRPAGAAPAAGLAAPPSDRDRIAAARRLWDASGPVRRGSAAALYLGRRGILDATPVSPALRAHAAAPVSVYRPGTAVRPALVAAITDDAAAVSAVEVTYLQLNGLRARLRLPRKTVGRVPAGAAVRLDAIAEELLVAEGVFTALSARLRFGLPAWALLSAGRLRGWQAPQEVRRVLIAADRGAGGEAAAEQLARSLRRQGVRVSLRLPPWPYGDWNDAWVAAGKEEGGSRAPQAGGMARPRAGDRSP